MSITYFSPSLNQSLAILGVIVTPSYYGGIATMQAQSTSREHLARLAAARRLVRHAGYVVTSHPPCPLVIWLPRLSFPNK
jgi:hypothetical protein